ncbi:MULTISPECIES: hypothetical protein [Salinibaculum]|uniref:hypothetical protein n=1 Tax=Salinibaculum TaxID=2732368 RepID=UPI0030D4A955
MQERDPAKRIPKSIGTDANLVGTYTLSDAAVALFPGVIVILLTQAVLPSDLSVMGYSIQTLTIPLATVAIAVGAIFVYLTPAYLSSIDWLVTIIGYQRKSERIAHEEAKKYTTIERVYPDRGAIERTDGAFVGLVQVEPPTMALATDEEWEQKTDSFIDFLNTVIEFPIQIYSTTQAFPVDEYLARYESRLTDADVQANPALATLIENYVEWYRTDLADRRMTIRDHYVIVSVTPEEVQFTRESHAQKLARLPVVGLFIQVWFGPEREDEHNAMFEALDERLRRVQRGLRGIDGCNAHRVEATDATALIAEFWSGDDFAHDDLSRVLRTRPLVGGTR